MLTDDDLTQLLGEAAETYPVPEPEFALPQEQPKPVWQRRGPQLGAAAAAVVLVGALLSQNGSTVGLNRTVAGNPAAGSSPHAGEVGGGTTGGSTGGSTGGAAETNATSLTYGATAPGAALGSKATTPEQDSSRVVKTGTVSLVVDDGKVSATVQRLQVLVSGARGYVANSTSEEEGEHPSASLTIRVPVASFETLISQVRALKVKVVSAETSGRDVTATYADTQAQIQTLQAARGRYLAILAGAKTIAETLTVQQRIDDVQGQIDRLEGQRRVLANQSDLATLTVSVAEQADQMLLTTEPSGWSKAWDDATGGFTSGIQALIAHSGRTLLVLLVGAALFLLGRPLWHRARRSLV